MAAKKKPTASEPKQPTPAPIFDREEGNMDPGVSLPAIFSAPHAEASQENSDSPNRLPERT